MSLLDRLRRDPVVRQLRRDPVLAVPAGVGADAVDRYARAWAPHAVRAADGLVLGPNVRLCGPIGRTEQRWRAAGIPVDAAACYVAVVPPALPGRLYGRGDLILGLHRRLGGWCRFEQGEQWRDTSTWREPRHLSVHAPVTLTPDDVVRLLAEDVPRLRQTDAEPDMYELSSERVRIDVFREQELYEPYPWVLAQPWYRPTEPVTEYALYAQGDGDPDARRSVELAVRSLVTATGGLILDLEGFPWP